MLLFEYNLILNIINLGVLIYLLRLLFNLLTVLINKLKLNIMTKQEIIKSIKESNALLGIAQVEYKLLSEKDKATLNVLNTFRDYAIMLDDFDTANAIVTLLYDEDNGE